MPKRKTRSEQDVLAAWNDPEQAARLAGLRYVCNGEPGLRRQRRGRGFVYLDPDGQPVADAEVRERLDSMMIPPAWTEVWICEDPEGHLLATGRDEKGRKQYLYHPAWAQVRGEAKFTRLLPFGEALAQIRARTERDLRRRGLPREKVLATVVRLLDDTLIRVGNLAYAQENSSFGLTTLQDHHVDFARGRCTFEFTGKSGKKHCIELADPRLARIIRECRDVPGIPLFQYDDGGVRGSVTSTDVNAYLRETTGQDFTAKEFRTWGGSVHAAVALTAMGAFATEREARKNVAAAVRQVSERLGNTTTVCRAYYIHPALIAGYLEGTLLAEWPRYLRRKPLPTLQPHEQALLHFLREHALLVYD